MNATKKYQIEERRRQVANRLAMGMTEQQIADSLGVSRATISRGVSFLKVSQTFIYDLAKTDLAFYHKQCVDGIQEASRQAWANYYKLQKKAEGHSSTSAEMDSLMALQIIKELTESHFYLSKEGPGPKRRFTLLIVALIVTILIDTAIVKIYDVVDKNFIPLQPKEVLFALNGLAYILLRFFIIRQLRSSFKSDRSGQKQHTKLMYIVSFGALCILGILVEMLIFQQFYFQYYTAFFTIYITAISYGTSAAFIAWLSILVFSWHRSSHSKVILLYFLSMLIISSNLILTAISTCIKVTYRPELRGPYVGGGGEISGGRDVLLNNILRITSFPEGYL